MGKLLPLVWFVFQVSAWVFANPSCNFNYPNCILHKECKWVVGNTSYCTYAGPMGCLSKCTSTEKQCFDDCGCNFPKCSMSCKMQCNSAKIVCEKACGKPDSNCSMGGDGYKFDFDESQMDTDCDGEY